MHVFGTRSDMNIQSIRDQIRDTFHAEEVTHALERLVTGSIASSSAPEEVEDKADQVLRFIHQYIEATPNILETTLAAAETAGMRAEFEPIIDRAFRYFHEQLDLIPDHLGLVGLLDDAYLTQSLVQNISHAHAERTGLPLLTFDLGPANRSIRAMIGEPLATHLDHAIEGVLAIDEIERMIERLESLLGHLPLALGDPYDGIVVYQSSVNIQLGQLGAV